MSGKYEIGFHESLSKGLLGSIVALPSKLQFRYTFENFFHPFVGEIVAQLNRGSLASIYDPAFLEGLAKDFFKADYDPAATAEVTVASFKKEIDLRASGAYANYNWELFFHIPLTIAVHL